MLADLIQGLRENRGIAHKRDIDAVAQVLRRTQLPAADPILIGDDCAAIPDGDHYLLFAIEGFLPEFVETDPWFAGYCAIMVNASDIYAMGGRPIAVVDALWSCGFDGADPVLEGLTTAANIYGIPVVGGHTNTRARSGQLAAAILGRTKALLTSFDAQPGQALIAAVDLRGRYREPANYWDASTTHDLHQPTPEQLRADLELLPRLAEDGLCRAGKDISMGGIVGSALMLMECSGVGGVIDLDALPIPPDVGLARWLATFPSYGFVLAVDHSEVPEVLARFAMRAIDAAVIGEADASGLLQLEYRGEREVFWDLNQSPLIGFAQAAKEDDQP
jgi:AIR synthase-related protein